LAIEQAVLALDAKNNEARRAELIARIVLARLSMAKGNSPEAISQLKVAATFAESLIKTEPDNTFWAETGSELYSYYGEDTFYVSDMSFAHDAATRACAIANDLVKRDPSVVRWRGYLLSRCQLLQAMLKAHSGNQKDALDLTQEVALRIDGLPAHDKEGDQLIRWQFGAALLANGDALRATGQSEAARLAWERAVAVLAPQQDREDAAMQTILAAALLRLDRRDEAALIIAKLDGIGYAHPTFIALKTPREDASPGTSGATTRRQEKSIAASANDMSGTPAGAHPSKQ